MADQKVKPKCPLCNGENFNKEEGKIDSKWGATAHKVTLLICNKCGNVLIFSEGRTLWDMD
ncbi:hypothetical protein HYU95_02135 [Candidatus Daviesbacteria bacterium]|nr:hypothetical protein [Candidatus Daviesbacteria bacterium]